MEKSKGLKLFGVRIFEEEVGGGEEVMRKCASMGNLVSCAAPAGENSGGDHAGYSSDGGLLKSNRKRRRDPGLERKKGVPWTEEEHRSFLAGLEKLGKGDWRGISRSFVTTRTPTQVASHAQKYFLRQTNPSKKKRRSSLFDVQINEKAGGSTMFEIKHDEIVNEDNSRINNPYNDSISSGGKEQEGPVVMDSDLELSIGLPSKLPSSQYAAIGAIRVL